MIRRLPLIKSLHLSLSNFCFRPNKFMSCLTLSSSLYFCLYPSSPQVHNLYFSTCWHPVWHLDSRCPNYLNLTCLTTSDTLSKRLYKFKLGFLSVYAIQASISSSFTQSSPQQIMQINSRGTLSNAFPNQQKPSTFYRSFFLARYCSCSWWTYENSICCASPFHKSKLHVVNFHNISHPPSNHSFIACSSSLCPCMSHISVHHPFLCRHSPTPTSFHLNPNHTFTVPHTFLPTIYYLCSYSLAALKPFSILISYSNSSQN